MVGWSMGVDIHGDRSWMRDRKSETKHIDIVNELRRSVVVGFFAQEFARI